MKRYLRLFGCVSLAIVALAFAVAPAAASTVVLDVTQAFQNMTIARAVVEPCQSTTILALATITINGAFHITVLSDNTFWTTFTGTGNFTLVPGKFTGLDLTSGTFSTFKPNLKLVSYTGHVTIWDGANGNLQNQAFTSTLEGHATGTDGSTLNFHDVMHLSVSASGIVLSFDSPTCA